MFWTNTAGFFTLLPSAHITLNLPSLSSLTILDAQEANRGKNSPLQHQSFWTNTDGFFTLLPPAHITLDLPSLSFLTIQEAQEANGGKNSPVQHSSIWTNTHTWLLHTVLPFNLSSSSFITISRYTWSKQRLFTNASLFRIITQLAFMLLSFPTFPPHSMLFSDAQRTNTGLLQYILHPNFEPILLASMHTFLLLLSSPTFHPFHSLLFLDANRLFIISFIPYFEPKQAGFYTHLSSALPSSCLSFF